jgi:hypothetical protein
MAVEMNDQLYDRGGIAIARAALKPGGVLAVWSAEQDRRFERRLRAGGFHVDIELVKNHLKRGRGRRHTILLARRIKAPAV